LNKIDQGIEAVELIEAEIDTLMRRMIETDPDAMLRLERLMYRLRIENKVRVYSERNSNIPKISRETAAEGLSLPDPLPYLRKMH
jgi:hypothetical protein